MNVCGLSFHRACMLRNNNCIPVQPHGCHVRPPLIRILFFMAAKDPEREYDFVEQPPEEFFCPVTFAVLLEPYLTQCCGNHLSQEAYQRLQGQPCPVCREENLAAVKDNFHKRKALSLKVRCPHKAEGCEWQGELRSLEQHVAQSCEHKVIQCDFSYAGCGAQLQRRLMSAHMKEGMEAHLSLLSLVVAGLMKRLVPPVDIIMDDFEEHKKSDDPWFSPPFYTHLGGYMMCLKVYANGQGDGKDTHVTVAVCLMRGEFDDLLKWPFRGDVTIKLKKTDLPHYQKIIPLNNDTPNGCVYKPKERNTGRGYGQYISHVDLYAGGYLKDDKLVFRVSDIVVKSK